jgi:superoxide dismutase
MVMFKLSEQTNELFAALSKFQGELDNASKSKQGHGYKYADLAECINIAKAPLAATGLAVSQMLGQSESGKQTLITILTHASGQYMMSEFDLVDATLMGGAGKNPAQVLGSAITYQRRYAYTAIIGMAQQDDDAASCVQVNSNRTNSNNHNKSQLITRLDFAIRKKGYTQAEVEAHVKKSFTSMSENELNDMIQAVNGWAQKVA